MKKTGILERILHNGSAVNSHAYFGSSARKAVNYIALGMAGIILGMGIASYVGREVRGKETDIDNILKQPQKDYTPKPVMPLNALPVPERQPAPYNNDAPERNAPAPDNNVPVNNGKSVANYDIKLKKMLIRHEGKRNDVYTDTRGNKTIGIGHMLRKDEADITYMNDGQIMNIFDKDVSQARKDAREFCGYAIYDSLPDNAKFVIDDMAFNLGLDKLSRFKQFRKYVQDGEYKNAAKAMVASRWYGQVGNRSKELVRLMESAEVN